MIRRSRISVRPNVKPAGRSAVTTREAPQGNESTADLRNRADVQAGAQVNVPEIQAGAQVNVPEIQAGAQETVPEIQAGAQETIPEIQAGAQETVPEVQAGAQETVPEVQVGAQETVPEVQAGAQETIPEIQAGAQEIVPEVPTILGAETKEKTKNQGVDLTSQSDLSMNSADVGHQSASTSSVSTRRKRFSVLPNLTKLRSSTLTSSKLRKSPARPETTPEVPLVSTHTSSALPKSPDKHEPAQELAPEPLPGSTKPLQSPVPKLPSSSVGRSSKDSRFHTKSVTITKPPEKALPAPEPSFELPPASLTTSEGKSKRRNPKPVTPTGTLSSRLDEAETQSANQDAAESSFPNEEFCADPSATVSEPQNEPDVQDGNDLSSLGESKKVQQNVPLALGNLNDPVDRLRLARARKLRELLKNEINKDKNKHQKSQTGINHQKKIKDQTKMTMRELIYYLPSTNPMRSPTEDEQRAETDVPSSPKAVLAVPSVIEENAAAEEEEVAEEEEEEEVAEEEEEGGMDEEPTMAPRVKVAEDGSLIIDEESLTVRVQRMKGPNPAEERDPIFERGSTTTYSSFRKGTYTKPWSNRETDMFFLAISMVGTDFSMIGQLFPHRARIEIKNKFKKEERANSWRIDKAFKEKRRLDLDFFKELLAHILKAEEKKREKKKRAPRISNFPRRRPGERKRKIYSSDSEEDQSSSSDAVEREKENEAGCKGGGSSAAPKRQRAKVSQKKGKQSAEQEAEGDPERNSTAESPVNELDSVEQETESFGVKPVRRWKNMAPVVQRKDQDTPTSVREESAKESHDSTASVQEKMRPISGLISCEDSESEEEPDLSTIQEHILNKPTRSGRIPKLSQQMIRAAADEEDDEEEEQLPPLPLKPNAWSRGSQAKRGRWCTPRSGKSRLLTLRASATEEDDDEEEECTNKEEENYSVNAEEENQAFVPMGLRSVRTVQSDVEETMEELDISVNVPDVLGISQNAVCPESSCERALATVGSVPCEHQLDLLVDVIEFLAPDHMEVSEEAARTLLTIGHSAQVIQTGEAASADDVISVKEPSIPVHEEVLMETAEQPETIVETCEIVTSDFSSTITSQSDPVVTEDKTPPQNSTSTAEPISSQENKLLSKEIQLETSNIIVPEPTLSKTQKNCLPKPNPNRASRTTQREPAEADISPEEMPGSPVKNDLEARNVVSQISTVKDFIDEELLPAEPEVQNAEIREERENHRTEVCSSVPLLEDADSGQRSFVEDERKAETQQADSEPKSSGSECSMKPSQPVRCRGPKPKPNLVRSVRTAHIQRKCPEVPDELQAANIMCTGIQQSDKGANLTPELERETLSASVKMIPDTNPEEPPGALCEASTSDEPVFILSLTEVLPTLTERAALVTEPLPLPATSETFSEPISAIEDSTADVGATGPVGDQVISQLLPNALILVSEKHETENRENKTMTEENVNGGDHLAKRKKLQERGRRAKLQTKPNPVQRKVCRNLLSLNKTRSAPQPEPQPSSASTEVASSSAVSDNSKTSISSTEQTPEISPPPVRKKTPPIQCLPSSPASQGIVENVNLSATDLVEPSASVMEAGSQPVHQTSPLASTGPLARPGRRPKGFLSFISSTSTQRPSQTTRTPQKPAVIMSLSERRRAAPNTSAPPPSPPQPPHARSDTQTETPSANPSAAGADQEPTSVSAFFFNDIFTAVDE